MKRFSSALTGEEKYMPGEIDELLKARPLRSELTCWVNPANPREALLIAVSMRVCGFR